MDGAHVNSPSALKDCVWDSYTCTLGWYVQGAWPEYNDGTNVNSVHRSKDSTLLAAADDVGRVKVFRYPCLAKGADYVPCRGHNHAIGEVRFTTDDKYMVTVGQKVREGGREGGRRHRRTEL